MSMHCEVREPHDPKCECDYCVADRRYETAHGLAREAYDLGIENNRLLSMILDELRARKR
jgi:glutaredoxin